MMSLRLREEWNGPQSAATPRMPALTTLSRLTVTAMIRRAQERLSSGSLRADPLFALH